MAQMSNVSIVTLFKILLDKKSAFRFLLGTILSISFSVAGILVGYAQLQMKILVRKISVTFPVPIQMTCVLLYEEQMFLMYLHIGKTLLKSF